MAVETHGHSVRGNITPEYSVWKRMLSCCRNKRHRDYPHYGGRGIRVCDRWTSSFESFFEDVGQRPSPKHSLDRYPNNNGDYEPSNVRWATRQEQMRNCRANVKVNFRGKEMCLIEATSLAGVDYHQVVSRMWRGQTFDHAVSALVEKAWRI